MSRPWQQLTRTVVSTSPSSNGTYQTKIFRPGFSVDVPAGWIVLERDTTAAQIYVECDTCAHGGEENGEITLDSTLAALSPEDTIARLRGALNVDPHAAAGGAAQEFASTASEMSRRSRSQDDRAESG